MLIFKKTSEPFQHAIKPLVIQKMNYVNHFKNWTPTKLEGKKLVDRHGLRFRKLLLKDEKSLMEAFKQGLISSKAMERFSKSDKKFYQGLTTILKDNRKILSLLIEEGWNDALRYASVDLKADRELVIEAVKSSGCALEFADETFKMDREIVTLAIRNDPGALQFVRDKPNIDRSVLIEAVQKRGSLLQHVDEDSKQDMEIVYAAVQRDGTALQYAHFKLQKNSEIVTAAIEQNGTSIQYAVDFQNDKKMVLKAVKETPEAFRYINKSFRKDWDCALAAIEKDCVSAMSYIDKSLMAHEDFIIAALKLNQKMADYIDPSFMKHPRFLRGLKDTFIIQ